MPKPKLGTAKNPVPLKILYKWFELRGSDKLMVGRHSGATYRTTRYGQQLRHPVTNVTLYPTYKIPVMCSRGWHACVKAYIKRWKPYGPSVALYKVVLYDAHKTWGDKWVGKKMKILYPLNQRTLKPLKLRKTRNKKEVKK